MFRCGGCQTSLQGSDIKNRRNMDSTQWLNAQTYPWPECTACSQKLSEAEIVRIFPERLPSEVDEYFVEFKQIQERKRLQEEREERERKLKEEARRE